MKRSKDFCPRFNFSHDLLISRLGDRNLYRAGHRSDRVGNMPIGIRYLTFILS